MLTVDNGSDEEVEVSFFPVRTVVVAVEVKMVMLIVLITVRHEK